MDSACMNQKKSKFKSKKNRNSHSFTCFSVILFEKAQNFDFYLLILFIYFKFKSPQVGSARFAHSAKTTNQIQKIWTNPNFEQTQNSNKPKSFRVGSARFARSAKNNKPSPKKFERIQTSNIPRIQTNWKVFEWAPLASLVPQKQQTDSKKHKQIQATNKSRIRKNQKIVNSVSSIRFAKTTRN